MKKSAKDFGAALQQATSAILQDRRAELDVTYEAVGKAADMTAAQVHRYLKQGRPIPMSALGSLCNALRLNPATVVQQAHNTLREQGW